jgi:hypothetical protein
MRIGTLSPDLHCKRNFDATDRKIPAQICTLSVKYLHDFSETLKWWLDDHRQQGSSSQTAHRESPL